MARLTARRACHAGHFYFTQLLIPVLLAGASNSPDRHARVVNTSSMGHTHVAGVDFDTLRDHPRRKKMGTQKLHFQSKFVSVPPCARERGCRWGGRG